MSSALRAEQPSRTWWSLSPKPSRQDLSPFHSSGKPLPPLMKAPTRGLPSFASIIGFKSKKHPVLAIQDPPPPISRPAARIRREIPFFQTPTPTSPSKDLSSDGERRHSLLTLSDTDPFGARGVAVHSHEYLASHSNSSFLDVSEKRDKHSLYARASSSSSSSNSHSLYDSHASSTLRAQTSTSHQRTLSASKSLSNIRRHAKQADPDPNAIGSQLNSRSSTRPTGMTRSKSIKPPLLHESHGNSRIRCPSSPARPPSLRHGPATKTSTPLDPNPRPSSRPPSAGHTPPAPAAPTLRIQRQTSFQRFQPPTAPPAFELPPPPKVPEEPVLENDDLDIPLASEHSLSSSNLSFGSSLSLSRESTSRETSDGDKWSFVTNLRPEYESETKRHMKPPLDIPISPQHLRVYSHSSPNQRSPADASPASSSEQSGVEASHKILKKRRSHHRLGLPPLSLGLKYAQATNATSVPSLPVPSTTLPTEPRGGNTSYHTSTPVVPTRKRVFSGSSLRRPSTSSGVPNSSHEDDVRSLFSLRSDHEMFTNASPLKPWPTNVSISASCWDDQPPLSPVRSDYTPQKIMSPEDQAKVEAELDDISVMSALSPAIIPLSPARSRATSMSTVFSDRDSEIIPSSIFSMPISESRSIRSPQVSSKSLISPTSEVGETIARWSAPQGKPKPVLPLSRRPSTASGVFGSGFVSPKSIIQSAASQSEASVKMDAHAGTTAIDLPTASIFPPKIRQPQRKSSDASNKPLTEQVRSLPPPPRPRAKAEVVINTQIQPYSHVNPSPEIGVESSIGVDFGHHRCPGLVESPSIQSMNSSTLSMRTVSSRTKGLRTSHVPTIPPRAPTRSGSSNSRRVRIAAPQLPPVTMNNGAKLSRRISLQRKPSFLDISDNDDDDETSEENLDFGSIMWISKTPSGDAASFSRGTYSTTSAAESFLEFGRDSFDTASDH